MTKRLRERPSPSAERAAPIGMLLDTNVILDVVLAREPWADTAAELLDAAARGAITGWVAGTTITTVHYIVERARDRATATTAVSDLLQVVKVVPLASEDFHRALALGLRDFEDAVQVAAGLRAGVQYLITRNARDFRSAPIDVRSPAEAVALISAELGE